MNRNIKIHVIFFVISLIIGLISISNNSNVYADEISDNFIEITIKLHDVANKPQNKYTLEIAPVDGNPEGIVQDKKEVTVSLENSQPENNIVETKVKFDFNSYEYNKTGIYRYSIMEKKSENDEVYPLSNEKYEVVIQVTEKDGEYIPHVIKPFEKISEETKVDTIIFNNYINNGYIKIVPTVKGAIADQNEYYKFKVWIDGNVGDTYNIIGQDEYVTYQGKKIKTESTYKIGEKGGFVYIYLKNNQIATIGISSEGEDKIYQIPVGTSYSVEIMDSRKVKTTINKVERKSVEEQALVAENVVEILIEKDFDIAVTGAIINIWPFAIVVLIAGCILVLQAKARKNINNDDYE